MTAEGSAIDQRRIQITATNTSFAQKTVASFAALFASFILISAAAGPILPVA